MVVPTPKVVARVDMTDTSRKPVYERDNLLVSSPPDVSMSSVQGKFSAWELLEEVIKVFRVGEREGAWKQVFNTNGDGQTFRFFQYAVQRLRGLVPRLVLHHGAETLNDAGVKNHLERLKLRSRPQRENGFLNRRFPQAFGEIRC
jgi:hypothetical protein